MDPHTHEEDGRLGWTVLLNLIITIAEYIGGIYSGSLALISDAGHNLSDTISLVIAFLGEKVSKRGASEKHSFGLKRVEVLTATINAIALLAIGGYIVVEALQRINNPPEISLPIMLGVGLVGLFGNLFSILILNRDRNKNINMRAAYLHLLYDTLSSVAVLASGLVIYFTDFYLLDLAASLFIAAMIIYSGLEVIKKTSNIFLQGVPEGVDFEQVYSRLMQVKGVQSVHRLHIWSISTNEAFLSCHVCVDNEMVENTDELIKKVNEILRKEFSIEHTTIQVENEKICDADNNGICCQ